MFCCCNADVLLSFCCCCCCHWINCSVVVVAAPPWINCSVVVVAAAMHMFCCCSVVVVDQLFCCWALPLTLQLLLQRECSDVAAATQMLCCCCCWHCCQRNCWSRIIDAAPTGSRSDIEAGHGQPQLPQSREQWPPV